MTIPPSLPLLRNIALQVLNATCTRLVASETSNALGNAKRTYTPGASSPCGYGPSPRQFSGQPILRSTETNQIRLPLTFTVALHDRIRIDTMNGSPINVLNVYELIGDPIQGPTLRLFTIKLVTDGS